jgi:ParB/RepB/Spo0J family partition protein
MGDTRNIPMADLRRSPIQLRTVRKETMEYMMLRDSIRKSGVLSSLLVRPCEEWYEVVLGSHRYEVALDLNLESLPCQIRDIEDDEAYTLQVEENVVRVETLPSEYARRMQTILNRGEMTVNQLARSVSRHPDTVKKWLSFNYLSPKAKNLLDSGVLQCILGVELAKLPVMQQDELLSLHSQFPTMEYLEMIRQCVREHRGAARKERGASKAGTHPTFRQFRKVRDEYLTPREAATVLTRSNAKTALDGWKAAIEWILSMDESTVRERVARHERKHALNEKRLQSLNLERKRDRNEQ